jgi:ABC-type bacteriocin/lantibiotic exporter with double-glycine peptidase domain
MPERPPLYKQETDYSCVPACLRMVLASLGVFTSEQELRELCDCTVLEGTSALKAVDAARALGFKGTRKRNLIFDDLMSELERGLFPIAYMATLLPPHALVQKHAAVVIAIQGDEIKALDPARGEVAFSKDEFLAEWNSYAPTRDPDRRGCLLTPFGRGVDPA